MTIWDESEHPRDNDGKFTYKNGGATSDGSKEKSLSRADILYPTMRDKEQRNNNIKMSIGNNKDENLSREDILYTTMKNKKDEGILTGGAASIEGNNKEYIETNPIKNYENNLLNELKSNIKNKSIEISPKWSNNTKFSDSELKRARKFIQGIEKFEPKAYYPTTNDKLTIGYGHTGLVDGKPIKLGMKITEEKAEELYRKDFETHTASLKDIQVPLTNNQKLALASFLFNLGPNILKGSDMLKKLNKGDYEGAANEFDKYIHQRNKKTGKYEVLRGLIDRRAKEKKLFLTPDD